MEKAAYYKACISDTGVKRKLNEDCMLVVPVIENRNTGFLAMVCDGVGRTDKGEIASGYVKESIETWIKKVGTSLFSKDMEEIKEMIDEEIINIHESLIVREKESGDTYGTTLTLILVLNSSYIICHIGDSRCYSSYRNRWHQMTKDQTEYQMYLDKGIEVKEEKKRKMQSTLLQCIGRGNLNPRYYVDTLPPEYQILITTDGFYRRLENSDLNELFSLKTSAEEKLKELSKTLKERGETDDMTAVYIRKEIKN